MNATVVKTIVSIAANVGLTAAFAIVRAAIKANKTCDGVFKQVGVDARKEADKLWDGHDEEIEGFVQKMMDSEENLDRHSAMETVIDGWRDGWRDQTMKNVWTTVFKTQLVRGIVISLITTAVCELVKYLYRKYLMDKVVDKMVQWQLKRAQKKAAAAMA